MDEQNVNPPDEEPISLEGEDEQPVSLSADDEEPISLATEEDEPITLVDEGEGHGLGQLKTFGAAGQGTAKKEDFKRPLNVDQTGATRCRIFRTKMSVASIEALQQTINEWIDNLEIDVKHVSQTIGTIQGKTAEENLIITVWY